LGLAEFALVSSTSFLAGLGLVSLDLAAKGWGLDTAFCGFSYFLGLPTGTFLPFA